MITDADVKKLAKVFATKDDIQDLGQKIDDLKTRLDVLEDNVTGEIAKLEQKVAVAN